MRSGDTRMPDAPPPGRAAEQRAFLRDLALLLGLPLLGVVALLALWRPWEPEVYAVAAPDGIYEVAAGRWDWSTAAPDSFCNISGHEISFSPDRSLMHITQQVPWTDSAGTEHRVSTYAIEAVSRSHIRGAIQGEQRLTDDGVPVVWDLVLTGEDSYAWHRTDWASWNRTMEVYRCPEGAGHAVEAEPDSGTR